MVMDDEDFKRFHSFLSEIPSPPYQPCEDHTFTQAHMWLRQKRLSGQKKIITLESFSPFLLEKGTLRKDKGGVDEAGEEGDKGGKGVEGVMDGGVDGEGV